MRYFSSLALTLLLVGTLNAADRGLEITWIDVEGGAATLIVTPAGETVLIDSGNPGRRDADRIVKAIAAAGKRRIDHLVITHYHIDHFGGAAVLAEALPIGAVYDNGAWDTAPDKPDQSYREFRCEKRVQLKPGDVIPVKKDAQDESLGFEIRCLGGRQQFIDPPPTAADNASDCASAVMKDRDGSDNANSLVLLVRFGQFRFFDAGDLTWNQEAKLVCPKNLVGKVDVYQVTHHGLDASNNPLVLHALEPRVAIMNNGVTKGCMPEVVANLREQKGLEAVYQMHKILRPGEEKNNAPDEYIANFEKDCAANAVQLSVAADSLSYTVAIPATGHKRRFETVAK
jgi:beta-lactamase superfamily II metal-dependent hydrolase